MASDQTRVWQAFAELLDLIDDDATGAERRQQVLELEALWIDCPVDQQEAIRTTVKQAATARR